MKRREEKIHTHTYILWFIVSAVSIELIKDDSILCRNMSVKHTSNNHNLNCRLEEMV